MAKKIITEQSIWEEICSTSQDLCSQSPETATFIKRSILEQNDFGHAVIFTLVESLAMMKDYSPSTLRNIFENALEKNPKIKEEMIADLIAVQERDPACLYLWEPLLFFKGYRALQLYRFSHHLYHGGQKVLSLLIQSHVSCFSGVDIHPAALLGKGIMMDHATGIVVGETATVGDHSSLYHGVTLGATGKERGERHPKVGDHVFIGANSSVIGNVKIGSRTVIGASSMVIKDIPENSTVIGNPCRIFPRSEPMELPPR